MELRHIRYFIAAAEERNFGKAADRLFVTRPAVSQIIIDLEDELGLALFDRYSSGVQLTAAGQALLPLFKENLKDIHNSIEYAKKVSQGYTGCLKVGYGSLALYNIIFSKAINFYKEKFPDIAIDLIYVPSVNQLEYLELGKIDIGFSYANENDFKKIRNNINNFEIESIKKSFLIVSEKHHLSTKDEVKISELDSECIIAVPHSAANPKFSSIYSKFIDSGFKPKIIQEVDSINVMLKLVSDNYGVGFCIKTDLMEFSEKIKFLDLNELSISASFGIRWLESKNKPTPLNKMIDIVQSLI